MLFAVILACVVWIQPAKAQTRTSSKTQTAPSPTPQASPVGSPGVPVIDTPQVATEAIQLNQRLRTLPDRLVSNESLIETEGEINTLKEAISEEVRQTESAIETGAIFTELQQSAVDWQGLKRQVEDLTRRLTQAATTLENELRSLRSDESRWRATNETVKVQESPPELLDLTGRALADISSAVKSAEEQRARIVGLQQLVATQSSIVDTEIDHLKKATAESQRSLLEPDSQPLWRVQGGSQSEEGLGRLLQGSYSQDFTRLQAFIRTKRSGLLLIGLLTFVTLAFFLRFNRSRRTETAVEKLHDHRSLLQRPFSLALLVFLVAMIPLLYGAPNSAIALVNVVGLIPIFRLLKPRLPNIGQQMLVALVASVLSWHLIKLFRFPIWIKRDLLALFALGVAALFVWLARKRGYENANLRHGSTLILLATFSGIGLLCIAFFANLFGYVGLSDLLTQGTLTSAYRGVGLYTVVVVGSSLISLVLQGKPTEGVVTGRSETGRVARRLAIALGVTMVLIWIHTTLTLFAVREDLYTAVRLTLNYDVKIGSAAFTVSNIVAFFLTLVVGYLVASVTRAILGEEILPRLKLAPGLPNAIATVTHYVLLVLVFLFALAAAGFELSKFTVLTGALGVGLGFGLQNIVNNFVSGLILLFERPVRIGDYLEVGGVSGQVSKIGVRSSTLHSFDGSDLIIPNANLISREVVNWTLTGTRRQILLNIPVAYENDPTQVRDLLSATAASHSDVLDFPKPTALFLGFGNNALNFEVRFWAPRPEAVPQLKSDVALSIAAALSEAGIKVPVPQPNLQITRSDQTETSDRAESMKRQIGEVRDRNQGAAD